MSHVFLTGATGFVGRQILSQLLAAGHRVTATVRPASALSLAAFGRDVILIETDDLFCENAAWWTAALSGIDTLIHAAWYVEPGKYLDSAENLICASAALTMTQGAVAAGVSHVIGIGTCFEYRLPNAAIAHDAPVGPVTVYAAAKLSVFQILDQWLPRQNVGFSWCRLFYLFGEGEHPARLVPYVKAKLAAGETAKLSAGTQLRDFLDVAEAGRMIASIVATRQPGVINICSGQAVTICDFVTAIAGERADLLEFGTAALHPSDPSAVVGICNLVRAPS